MSKPRPKAVETYGRKEIIAKVTRRGTKYVTRKKAGGYTDTPTRSSTDPPPGPLRMPSTPTPRGPTPGPPLFFQLDDNTRKKNVKCPAVHPGPGELISNYRLPMNIKGPG